MVGYAVANPPTNLQASMQPEHAVHGAQFGRLDQLGMRDGHRVKRTVELLLPEGQEILQRRKFRKHVVVLPDVGLEQRGMIRHAVENLRRRQPVTQHLFPEIVGNNPNPRDHANLPCRSAYSGGWLSVRPTSHPVEMRSHETNVTQTDNSSQAQKFNKLLKFNALAANEAPC